MSDEMSCFHTCRSASVQSAYHCRIIINDGKVLNREQARRPAIINLNYSKLSGEKRREYDIIIVFLSLLPVLPFHQMVKQDVRQQTNKSIKSLPSGGFPIRAHDDV
jgi:hypothetical protein